jgi:hypothetical protein
VGGWGVGVAAQTEWGASSRCIVRDMIFFSYRCAVCFFLAGPYLELLVKSRGGTRIATCCHAHSHGRREGSYFSLVLPVGGTPGTSTVCLFVSSSSM